MAVDTGDGYTGHADIEINQEANDSADDEQNDQTRNTPGNAALNLDLFFMGEVFPPSKDKRLAITPRFDARRLLMVPLCFRSSLIFWPSYMPPTLPFLILPSSSTP